MQFLVLLSFLVGIFVSTEAAKPRSINVALDTVLEFDKASDIDLITQVQEILNKVKNIIKDNPKQDKSEHKTHEKLYKFSDFLEDVVNTLLSFDDKDLKEIVQIVHNELRDISQNHALEENLRRYLRNKLDHIELEPVRTIRKNLFTLSRSLKNAKTDKMNDFLGFLNTLYKRDAEKKLSKFISKLKTKRRSSLKSEEMEISVRKLVTFIIVDYFSTLPENTKKKIEARVKDYLHDDKSTIYNKNYPRIQHKPRKFNIEPERTLQNSEDLNMSEEPINIDEKSFKNQYRPQLLKDKAFRTKALVKNDVFNVKHKKDNDEKEMFTEEVSSESNEPSEERESKSKYTFNIPHITHMKPKRGQNKVMDKKSSKAIKSSKRKLTHITFYPFKMSKQSSKARVIEFKPHPAVKGESKISLHSKEDKVNKDTDALALKALNHSAQINIHLKNNEVQFITRDNKDQLRKDALTKVRAFRQKLETRTTKDNDEVYERRSIHIKVKRKHIATTRAVEYFGNLFKRKSTTVDERDSSFMDKSIDHAYKITEYLKKMEDKIEIGNYKNRKISSNEIDETRRYNNEMENEWLGNEVSVAKKISEQNLTTVDTTPQTESGFRRTQEATAENKSLFLKFSKLNESHNSYGNFVDNTHHKVFKAIEITTRSSKYFENDIKDIRLDNQIFNKVSPNITFNHINRISKSNPDIDNELTHSNDIDYNMESTITTTVRDNHKSIIPINFNTKSNKIIKEIDVNNTISNKTKVGTNLIDDKSMYRKMVPKKLIYNDTKNENNYKTSKNLTLDFLANQTQLPDLRRKMMNYTKINKYNKLKSEDTLFKAQSIKNTNFNLKNIKPAPKNRTLEQELQINNTIKTIEKHFDNFDNQNNEKRKDLTSNNKEIDHIRKYNVNTNTTSKIVFKDEKLDAEFKHKLKSLDKEPIDVMKYLKNPEVAGVEDKKKKQEIEEKMKEELGNLFTSPVTKATTTAAYTDIFEVMEDEFGLGPL